MVLRLLIALAASLLLLGCGEDDSEESGEESARDVSLAEAVERPPLPGETVAVSGEATPLEDVGFELADGDGNAIVVVGGEGQVDAGEQVRVIGTLDRITQPLATELANRLEGSPDIGARTSQGTLYLKFERLAPD